MFSLARKEFRGYRLEFVPLRFRCNIAKHSQVSTGNSQQSIRTLLRAIVTDCI